MQILYIIDYLIKTCTYRISVVTRVLAEIYRFIIALKGINVKEKNQALYECLILMNGFTDDITAIFSDTLFLVFIQFFRIDRFAIF